MSKSTMGQKRSLGKKSPMPKRPKLDFTSIESPRTRNGYYSSTKENTALPDKKIQNTSTSSEWDEDFSGDVLEKVCLIAELSQQVVSKEPVALVDDIGQKNKNNSTPIKHLIQDKKVGLEEELEKIKLENEKLKESFKTKEGEVGILRSQIKHHQETKQSEALHHSKVLEEMQKKYEEKLSNLEKGYESLKTELQFKDLELESLKCKQMETSASKIRKIEPEAMHVDCRKSLFNSSQIILPAKKEESVIGPAIVFDFPDPNSSHDGKNLANLICPEFFKFIEEPDIIPLYTFHNGTNCHMSRLDFDKREKYKWSGLPKQTAFIKDTYDLVSNLFLYDNFSEKKIKVVISDVLGICRIILKHQKDVLVFLEEIQRSSCENDDIDQSLLENDEEVNVITIKKLLGNEKIREEECGIEARRSLALILSLIQSSNSILEVASKDKEFLTVLKNLATSIGNLRRPLRYTGVLVGIVFIIKEILSINLEDSTLLLIREALQEVIFARPKLDVFREIIMALQVGRHHLNFLSSLCRKGSGGSLLFMDSKLQQAMFFTKDACPLKLLSTQIMGLACMPCNRKIRSNVTDCIVNWLNFLMDTHSDPNLSWFPCNSGADSEDRCFDITECLVYLLNLCVRDYKTGENTELISVIGKGAALIQRILKLDQRFHDNMHNLRLAVELKTLKFQNQSLPSVHVKAISWIVDLFESDLKNQDGCVKQNIYKISNEDIVNALKINNNDSKIY